MDNYAELSVCTKRPGPPRTSTLRVPSTRGVVRIGQQECISTTPCEHEGSRFRKPGRNIKAASAPLRKRADCREHAQRLLAISNH